MNAHSPVPAAPVAEQAQRDTPKSRRTRRRILDAAMKLFAQAGYHAATNADLTYDAPERTERLIAVVKRVTHMINRKGGVSDLWSE